MKDIDLHGCYPDEVEYLIDRFISECKAYGESIAHVIHGKGEGILRNAAVSALNKYKKDILSIEQGDDGMGGSLKVKFKYTKKVKPYKSKPTVIKEKANTYLDKITEKRELGREQYLKRMRNKK